MFRSLALAVLSLFLFSLSPAGASTMSNHFAYAGDNPVRVSPSNRQADLVGVLPGHVIHGLDDWEFHVVTLRGLRTRLPGVCSWSPALALTYLIETTVPVRETLVLSSFDGIGRDGVVARGGSGVSALRFGGGGFGKGSTPTANVSPVSPSTGTPGTGNGGNNGNGGNTGGTSPLDTILGDPVKINQSVAAMAANAYSIAYGDLSKYIIRDAMMMEMYRFTDSAYAKKGQVGFLAFLRSGGNLMDVGGAVKTYRNSAS